MDSTDPATRIARTASVAEAGGYEIAAARDTTIRIFGLPLTRTNSLRHAQRLVKSQVRQRPREPFLVTFASPLAVKLVESDRKYRANLHRMSLVFCDAIALAWAARGIGRYPMERVSFDSTSLAPPVFAVAEKYRRAIALVGSRRGVAEAAADRIRECFPGIRIVAAIDGYRPVDRILAAVMDIDPDIVVCGMGAPRQEAFLTALADAGWCGTGFTCGGYLDQLVDRFDFYPAIIDRLDLRWLYRIAREPRRLGYRYVVEYAPFFRAVGREIVSGPSNSHWRSGRS
jgi:N-acetylglucosaminyldiphosphoundecaprenol N-acetyl-beta-D-mannosaminyltransferase